MACSWLMPSHSDESQTARSPARVFAYAAAGFHEMTTPQRAAPARTVHARRIARQSLAASNVPAVRVFDLDEHALVNERGRTKHEPPCAIDNDAGNAAGIEAGDQLTNGEVGGIGQVAPAAKVTVPVITRAGLPIARSAARGGSPAVSIAAV
jgi:hypothetical protein